MLKTRFLFFMQVPAVIQKHLKSPRIVILKALCRFVVVLLSTFSVFAAGFSFAFGNFAHYCVVLLNALWAIEIKDKLVCNGLLFAVNLDPLSLTPGGSAVLLVCGFRRRDNLQTWREVVCEPLWARIWFWEECNHFERIYRVYGFDRFSSNFTKIL